MAGATSGDFKLAIDNGATPLTVHFVLSHRWLKKLLTHGRRAHAPESEI